MIETAMKKAEELACPRLEDHTQSLKFLIRSLPLRSTSRAELNESLRLCESLRTAIQAKLASHVS